MNEIINAIPEYVITAVVSTAIFYALTYAKNLIHARALTLKQHNQRNFGHLLSRWLTLRLVH